MAENNLEFRKDDSDKAMSSLWMRVYKITNGLPFPNMDICYIPRPCQHCEGTDHHHATPCVSVCPATATDVDHETGIVSQIYTRCVGCRYCMAACPYHVRIFSWYDAEWPGNMEKYLNPDVSPRMRGVVSKCTFCYHRLQRAREKAHSQGRRTIAEQEYQTACTQACPASAITFGDLNNPEHEVYKLKSNPNAFRLLENLGTNTKVYYISSREWVRKAGDVYLGPDGKDVTHP